MTRTTIIGKPLIAIVAIGVVGVLTFGGNVSAKKGVCKDGTPPPCKPSAAEEGVNNLSYPAVSNVLTAVAPRWNIPASPVLGVHYSYGCDQPETYDIFSYPNTSCVDELGSPAVYLSPSQCVEPGAPCEGFSANEISRIYWQKVEANDWWADSALETPRTAAYVNWADNLESNTWNERSVIRVETQPYGSLIPWYPPSEGPPVVPFNPSLNTCEQVAANPDDCRLGFQMWHVSGQGTTEQWGVRASDIVPYDPFIYFSPFQIIHTNDARLNLAKIEEASATCPAPGGDAGDPPPDTSGLTWVGDHWDGACTAEDSPYTVELNVGGKYVYGYNWRMKNVELDSLCGSTWEKTGWWRLTFYTGGTVYFDPANPIVDVGPPPEVPATASALPPVAAEEEETDTLYTPVVDYTNNLTYLDICVKGKTQGGGGGGGPRR
jgi:hypothetical protein